MTVTFVMLVFNDFCSSATADYGFAKIPSVSLRLGEDSIFVLCLVFCSEG